MLHSYAAVRAFTRNESGCDYFVGDIHGCFSQLEKCLSRVAFDPGRDRLFSVGDLIDRGPDSRSARAWLQRPWFNCCLGNHEAMLLSLGEHWREQPDWFVFNGGQWWFGLDAAERAAFYEQFAQLPFALTVDTAYGRVGVVHADVSPALDWAQFTRALEAGDQHARATALWSRARADGQVRHGVGGIDRVVCGHTIDSDIVRRGNVWFIDTGAFLDPAGERLTLLSAEQLFAEPPSVHAHELG